MFQHVHSHACIDKNKALGKIFEQMRDGLVNLLFLCRPRIKKGEQLEMQRNAKCTDTPEERTRAHEYIVSSKGLPQQKKKKKKDEIIFPLEKEVMVTIKFTLLQNSSITSWLKKWVQSLSIRQAWTLAGTLQLHRNGNLSKSLTFITLNFLLVKWGW